MFKSHLQQHMAYTNIIMKLLKGVIHQAETINRAYRLCEKGVIIFYSIDRDVLNKLSDISSPLMDQTLK